MYKISPSDLTPQLRQLIQQTLSTHEPLKISIDHEQTAILLPEQDYNQLIGTLNQIKTIVTKAPNVPKQRIFGSSQGLIKMADDFEAPLGDFKDYL
jgi:PHD/YefM family antitoxin component YafN of YafNO toxin-antitoxin module